MTNYWRARFDWCDALQIAQQYGIADSASLPSAENESRLGLVDKWREAVAKMLLTPAPDLAAVTWKRAQLKKRGFCFVPVKKERVERAIANDVAFLAAHPTRRTNSEVMTRRREFKAAMRQRIRDIAAARDLTEEEIKPVLTLNHEQIGNFCEQHGVRFEWLLEGRGRVFMTLGTAELAACVRTLPWAQQQTIEAMVVEMIDKRAQEEPPPNPPAA